MTGISPKGILLASMLSLLFLTAISVSAADDMRMTRVVETERGQAVADELIVKNRGEKTFHIEKLPRGSSLQNAEREWRLKSDVEYAEPNYIVTSYMMPNDPLYVRQWNLSGVGMSDAWDISTGQGVVVAVIDTGVAYEDFTQGSKKYFRAPDLLNTNFVAGYDFINNDTHPNDDFGHGTHVAGTIAGSTNNNVGVAGIAYNASIMPVKVLDSRGSGTHASLADGIRFAADNGAQVINLSLGGTASSETMRAALQYAYEKGVVIVAASGNGGSGTVGYPAAYDAYVIAVGATRYDKTRASYSNWGTSLDLMAPGGDTGVDQNGDGFTDGIVQQTFSGSNYGAFSYISQAGTSMASPHTAGVAALVIAHGNATTPVDVRTALESSADDLGVLGRDNTYGYGLVDPVGALLWGNQIPPVPLIPPTVDLKINGVDGPITLSHLGTSTLSWTTFGSPSSCTASGEWSGSKSVFGSSQLVGPLSGAATYTYTLLCENSMGSSSDSVSAVISAPPPTPVEVEVFADSFEISEWNNLWVEDVQNDWYRSNQRRTLGSYAAEVDGSANNATLTSGAINLAGKTNATITFSWLIESGLDTGEYLAFDVSTDNGSTWIEKSRLSGNVSQEEVWHVGDIDVLSISNLKIRFRGLMSGATEDANVDNVKVVAW